MILQPGQRSGAAVTPAQSVLAIAALTALIDASCVSEAEALGKAGPNTRARQRLAVPPKAAQRLSCRRSG